MWFVIDELAALGKLPALSTLMAEGRKYGACVLAGLQSLNQIYEHYGHYSGSSIFGQFGTSFFFRNNEPSIAKMISSMCGTETITRQQKNTSFGANEYRDGVSYNEHQQRKSLVEYSDIASLATGQCYAMLPEPEVRLSKIKTPEVHIKNKSQGFELGEVPMSKSMLYKGEVTKGDLNTGEKKQKAKRKSKSTDSAQKKKAANKTSKKANTSSFT